MHSANISPSPRWRLAPSSTRGGQGWGRVASAAQKTADVHIISTVRPEPVEGQMGQRKRASTSSARTDGVDYSDADAARSHPNPPRVEDVAERNRGEGAP